jgi:hypothetical protein
LGFIVIPRQSQLEFKRIKVEPGEQIWCSDVSEVEIVVLESASSGGTPPLKMYNATNDQMKTHHWILAFIPGG